ANTRGRLTFIRLFISDSDSCFLSSYLFVTGDVDLLKEECRMLREECQTLKEDNRRLSERLQLLQRQRTW
uniref:Uncharacterized protein n=1 Tax=Gouania willdenowi TaxID=441366 RepID=A0A8C5N1N2_GOUWI